MDFPSLPPTPLEPPADLLCALGETPAWCGADGMDLLALLPSEGAVRDLCPDLGLVARLPARGLIVTAAAERAGADYDFVSRFFAPAVGVPEDPVTGSAHCCLGPFWSGRLGKEEVVGYQASARGGTVRVRPRGDRVRLAGQAVTVLVAELVAG
jgi:predicted PhzF superfamily epimerase YddE/YHI9